MDAVDLFKCLADQTRLQIALLVAREGELCVCEITEALVQTQPKISRHLASLRHQGVLDTRRQGQWVYYRLADALPVWAREVLNITAAAQPALVDGSCARLLGMSGRPQRASCC
jgi:ArsR family transcriptional regulator